MKTTAIAWFALATSIVVSCSDTSRVDPQPSLRPPVDARTIQLAALVSPLIHHQDFLIFASVDKFSPIMIPEGDCGNGPRFTKVEVCHHGIIYVFMHRGFIPIRRIPPDQLCVVVFRNDVLAVLQDQELLWMDRRAIDDAKIAVDSDLIS